MSKNIVVCLDGTWNNAVSQCAPFTNVFLVTNMTSPNGQVKFYTPGVGAHVSWLSKYVYGITGKGVFQAARWGWTQINANYVRGDKIFIFGFSRGAFAARHLAGMLVRLGLGGWQEGVEKDFNKYLESVRKDLNPTTVQEVHFLGLWDCVPGNRIYMYRDHNYALLSKTLEGGIRNFRHAVSKYERRWSFRPLIFQPGPQASFRQHWFPGYHSDVGGGKGAADGLATFSLWWMIREAFECGLRFTNIDCQKHKAGNALSIIQGLDPDQAGVCSDYLSTRLGLVWDRRKREINPSPDALLDFSTLDRCPFGDHDMFDYF